MNTKGLTLLTVFVLALFGAVIIVSDGYDADNEGPAIVDVDLYKLAAETPEKVELRYYGDMPTVPYIGICQLYNIYQDKEMTVTGSGGIYTVENENGSAVIDLNKGTVYSEDYRKFSELSLEEWIDDPSIVEMVANTTEGSKAVTLRYADYNIKAYYDDGEVYFPLAAAADIFMSTRGFMMIYVPGTPESSPSVHMINNTLLYGEARIYTLAYLNSLIALVKYDRSADMAKFAYDDLCFYMDNFYGKVSSSVLGEQMRTTTLDTILRTSNDSNLKQIREWLLSTDYAQYIAGLIGIGAYFHDNGHTVIEIMTPLFMDEEMFPELAKDIAAELEKVKLPESPDLQQKQEDLKKVREAAWPTAVSLGGEDTYYEKGDTAVFSFNYFDGDFNAWADFVPGSTEYPEDSIGHFMKALNKAKSNPDIKNFVIDVSSNNGGTVLAVIFIKCMITGNLTDIIELDVQTSCKTFETYQADTNLDGKLDDDDLKKQYDFNFAMLTSSASFSSANMLSVYSKEDGIMTIGERSGGGICYLMLGSTADGFFGSYSSFVTMGTKSGKDMEAGAEPDTVLINSSTTDYAALYDIDAISKAMNDFYTKKEGNSTPIYIAIAIVVLLAIVAVAFYVKKKGTA